MRRSLLRVLALFAVLGTLAKPVSAQVIGPRDQKITIEPVGPHQEEIGEGMRLLASGQPAMAEKIFSRVIDAFEKSYDPRTPYRCTDDADNAKRTIALVNAQLGEKDFILGGYVWCAALFGKGFALIDLNRSPEAGQYLAKAVEMSPASAHYFNEYAEWFKNKHEWERSYNLFRQAWDLTSHDPKAPDRKLAARALRGMGFDLIELGRLDEAKDVLVKSLQFEPEAQDKVSGEIAYIAKLRGKN